MFVAPAQADPTGGGLFAVVVTFLVASLFYAVTLHLAASFVLGDVPSRAAATVGPVPAAVSILLQRWGPLVVLPATLAGDALAIYLVYDLDWRPTAVLTVVHLLFATALGLALVNLLGLA